ncbi:MAG: hypothetical protein KatS3mg096_764 [Candidatus Parcubacteria bacterium]|nr:MAG: hypothetical protein KatS3mg096_764 [Candidatus Parcubacteria bacterium]
MFQSLSNIFKPLINFVSNLFAPKPSPSSSSFSGGGMSLKPTSTYISPVNLGISTKTSTPATMSSISSFSSQTSKQKQTTQQLPKVVSVSSPSQSKTGSALGVPVSSKSEVSKSSSPVDVVSRSSISSSSLSTSKVKPVKQVVQKSQPQPPQSPSSSSLSTSKVKPVKQVGQKSQPQPPQSPQPSSNQTSVPQYIQDVAKQILTQLTGSSQASSNFLSSLYGSIYNLLPQEKRTGFLTPEEYTKKIGLSVQEPQPPQQPKQEKLIPEKMTAQDIAQLYQQTKEQFMPKELEIQQRESEIKKVYEEELSKLIEDIKNAYAVAGFSPTDPVVLRRIEELKQQATPQLVRELANLRRAYEQTAEEKAKDTLNQFFEIQKTRLTQEATTQRSLMEKYLDIVKNLENPTDEMRNYQYAVDQGYKGSFADFIMEKNAPAEWKEYQFAQQQGYTGSFLDFLKEKAQAGRDPSAAIIASLNLQYKPIEFGMKIQENMQQDYNIKSFNNLKPQIETFQNLIFNQKPRLKTAQEYGVYDTTLLTLISKFTDPTTGVREGELMKWSGLDIPTFQNRLANWNRMISSRGFLDTTSRNMIENILKNITNGVIDGAVGSYTYWKRIASQSGIPSQFIYDPVLEHMINNKTRLFPSVSGNTGTSGKQEITYRGNRYRGYFDKSGNFIYEEVFDPKTGRFVPVK